VSFPYFAEQVMPLVSNRGSRAGRLIAALLVVAFTTQAFARDRASPGSFTDVIRGRVQSPEGKPVEAWITASFTRDTTTVALETKTQFEGRFTVQISAPAPAQYTIHVRSTGFADTTFTVRANTGSPTTPDSLRVTEADVRLRRP
jgi:hypothetical protein